MRHACQVGDTWLNVAQVVSNLALLLALILSYLQLRAMRAQVAVEREAAELERSLAADQFHHLWRRTQNSNAFELMKYLEQGDHLEARVRVTALATKPYRRWSRKDRSAADKVARLWTHAARF